MQLLFGREVCIKLQTNLLSLNTKLKVRQINVSIIPTMARKKQTTVRDVENVITTVSGVPSQGITPSVKAYSLSSNTESHYFLYLARYPSLHYSKNYNHLRLHHQFYKMCFVFVQFLNAVTIQIRLSMAYLCDCTHQHSYPYTEIFSIYLEHEYPGHQK